MNMQAVPASSRRHRTLRKPLERFREAYRHIMQESDFRCMEMLIEKGMIEVVLDSETRGLELIPREGAEPFVKKVFEALVDEAAQDAA
jgi:hypothetical protein